MIRGRGPFGTAIRAGQSGGEGLFWRHEGVGTVRERREGNAVGANLGGGSSRQAWLGHFHGLQLHPA